ncbi:sigma-70 family RNA polymerase sigma factor [Polyangium spumosum]|uniref:Sigma-70 family RNA polymerase sigma factor n=1 Tax=Polyangium spumosum TaxID=889282 RepID=A0A6N7Q480_9BACT|nr:sigma-70 family RNA polymerase sigma factor [Polyangium spumosum]MRG98527.1 sigma-70 family RNA polymerase sigma factor [Polyangium spumosum]
MGDGSALARCFSTAWRAARPEAPADSLDLGPAELEALLASLLAAARAAWAGVHLEPDVFIPYLAARIGADVPLHRALTSSTCVDLYLACACARGDAAALTLFDKALLRDVTAALSRIDLGSTTLEDLRDRIRHRILVGEGDALPRIAEYTGRGDLRGWLRVVAVREALGLLRRQKREERVHHELELAELDPSSGDPELALIERRHHEAFQGAFREALAALSPRDRNLLRQHYRQGLGIDELGALHDVHRATAARWLAQARDRLASGTRQRMRERLRVEGGEVDDILRLLQSRLEITLRSQA